MIEDRHDIANPVDTIGKDNFGWYQPVIEANTDPRRGANTIKMGKCSVISSGY